MVALQAGQRFTGEAHIARITTTGLQRVGLRTFRWPQEGVERGARLRLERLRQAAHYLATAPHRHGATQGRSDTTKMTRVLILFIFLSALSGMILLSEDIKRHARPEILPDSLGYADIISEGAGTR
jgi:hypothetical protein